MGYTPYGTTAYSTGSATIKYQYTGQEKDACGLMYYNARYYDPELGRFIQPDTMLDGLNRYTYCGGNPIVYSDPSGHCWDWLIYVGIYLVGAYFSGATSAHSLNPADWTANDWWMAFTWGTGKIGGGWSSQNGPYVTVGDDIQYSPGEASRQQDTEQKIAQTQDNFMASLVEYNRVMAQYYTSLENAKTDNKENVDKYYKLNCSGQKEANIFVETEIDRIGSLFLSASAEFATTGIGATSPYLSTILDLVMLLPNGCGQAFYYRGQDIIADGWNHYINNSAGSWNRDLGLYRTEVGIYWQSVGQGVMSGKGRTYFIDLNIKLAVQTSLFYTQYPIIKGLSLHDLKYLEGI